MRESADEILAKACDIRHNTKVMKLKIATVILFLVCIGLGVMVVMRQKQAEELQKTTEKTSVELSTVSNQWQKTSAQLVEQQQVNTAHESTIKTREAEVVALSNKLTDAKTQLDKLEADSKAKEQAAQAELAKRDGKITELEGQKDDMSRRMAALTNQLAELQKQIQDTERKLTVSEGDREFLLKELKRLQTEKTDLERQFNDLKALKTQVSKLKEELVIARRLEFLRAGVFSGLKGAERLMMRPSTPAPKAATNFNLNVEFKQDGGAKVVPAPNKAAPATNAPTPAP
jgi:myosin heavy subunit